MKLTNCIRDAFLASAMADVPQVSYEAALEKEVSKFYQEILKAAGLTKADKDRLCSGYTYLGGRSFSVPGVTYAEQLFFDKQPKIAEILTQWKEQKEAMSALRTKLKGIAYGCTTDKQLIELLPEFQKYLPPEVPKTPNLPAISNVVGEFIRAGWPKDKPQATGAQA